MKLSILFFAAAAVAPSFVAGEERVYSAEDLQAKLDAAAASAEKRADLAGAKYRLEKSVVLDERHSGLTIDGGGALITGAKKISGWRKSDVRAGAWEADLKSEDLIPSIFVNGVRASCSRHPNNTRILAHSRIPDTSSHHGSTSGMRVFPKDGEFFSKLSDAEKKNMYLGTFRNWVQINVGFGSVEKKGNVYEVLFSAPLDTSMFRNCRYSSYIVYNTLAGFDEKGEFYFDRQNSKIYYLPRDGEQMESALVEYPAVITPFEIRGKFEGGERKQVKNIKIKNAKFEGAAVGFAKNSWKGRDFFAAYSQSAADSFACVKVSRAANVSFENCRFSKIDSYALWLESGVEFATVKNCEFTDIGLGGIKIGKAANLAYYSRINKVSFQPLLTHNITVKDCLIYKYGRVSQSGAGILVFDVPNCKIVHNEIFDGYYTGISYGWTWGGGATQTKNTSISFNKIHDLCFKSLNDIGGIYTLGKSPNSKIVGNVIENIDCLDYGAWGIYNDEGSAFWLVENNYVRNSSRGGYYMHYGQSCTIRNNIIRDSREYQFGLGRREPNSYTFTNNIVQFSPPATLFGGNNPVPASAAKIDSNAYFNKGGKLLFGELGFDQWRAESGQDANSVEMEVDIDALLAQKRGLDIIGFKPIDVSRAGVRGKMKKRAAEILAGYKYPPMFEHNFVLPEIPVEVDFSKFGVGSAKASIAGSGLDGKSALIVGENGAKFLRIRDYFPDVRPYFSFDFNLPSADYVELVFNARFGEKASMKVEFRSDIKPVNNPRMRILDGRIDGVQLPTDKWLRFVCVLPTHVNSDKTMRVEIFDADKKIASFGLPYKEDSFKFQKLFFISPNGGNGETFDISGISLKPLEK